MVAVAAVLMLAGARIAFQLGDVTYLTADRGLLFESPNLWISDTWLTMVVNTGLILLTAIAWILITQIFNPFRSLTHLQASFYVVMMLSVPDIIDQLCSGTILAALMPGLFALLWSSYADMHRLRHIFLLFTILSAFSMAQYCFAVYIPAFIVGCIQMKIFSLRTVIACILGLITPWWIVFGTGIADIADLHTPHFYDALANMDTDSVVNLVVVSVTTLILIVASWLANFMSVVSMNANLRAFNGSIAITAIFTMVALLIDFGNATSYLPALMSLTAYQLAFTFGRNNNERTFIPVLGIMGVYIALYAMRIFL